MEYIEINNGEIANGKEISSPAIVLKLNDSYYNSSKVLINYPTNYKLLEQSFKIAGVKMRPEWGRGGSDAADISNMGIPTYNMFAGSHNEHSNDEWVSSKQMLASYNVALNYIQLLAEKDREAMIKEGNPNYTPQIPELNMKSFDDAYQQILERYGNPLSNI